MDVSCPALSPVPFIVSDDAGDILFVSPPVAELLRAGAKLRQGMPISTFHRALKLDPADVLKSLGDTVFCPNQLSHKLKHMSAYTSAELEELANGMAPENVGAALLPVATGGGSVMTLKLVVAMLEHPGHGTLKLTLLIDETECISVARLLGMAGTGEYFKVMKREKLSVRSEEFRAYLAELCSAGLATGQVRRLTNRDPKAPSSEEQEDEATRTSAPSQAEPRAAMRFEEDEKGQEQKADGNTQSDC